MEKYSFGQELKENHEMTELELYRKAVVEKDKSLMAITKTTRFGPNLSFSSSLEDEPGKGSSSVVIDRASSPLSSEELVKQLDEKRRRRLRGK